MRWCLDIRVGSMMWFIHYSAYFALKMKVSYQFRYVFVLIIKENAVKWRYNR